MVAQRQREAIDFFLDNELRCHKLLLHLRHERVDLRTREDIREREHRHIMPHEHARRPHRLAADELRRRILRDELRIRLLDLLEPEHELVILIVRDLRIVFVIVTVIMVADLLAQGRKLALNLFHIVCHAAFVLLSRSGCYVPIIP